MDTIRANLSTDGRITLSFKKAELIVHRLWATNDAWSHAVRRDPG
jgi:hypothetical protein